MVLPSPTSSASTAPPVDSGREREGGGLHLVRVQVEGGVGQRRGEPGRPDAATDGQGLGGDELVEGGEGGAADLAARRPADTILTRTPAATRPTHASRGPAGPAPDSRAHPAPPQPAAARTGFAFEAPPL